MPHAISPTMPLGSPWMVTPASENSHQSHRSILGSIRKTLHRRSSNVSAHSSSSTSSHERQAPHSRDLAELNSLNTNIHNLGVNDPTGSRSPSRSPLTNCSPATRRPDRPGMNAFTGPSNEPPPAYTPSPTNVSGPTVPQLYELAGSSGVRPAVPAPASAHGEDPYSFLATFDTTLLIDDSGSMAGRSWREVSQALVIIAPIVAAHDDDGLDLYFMNHKSADLGALSDGVAPGGYRGIKRASTVTEIFERVRPQGGTPTGTRIQNILKPYLAKLETQLAAGRDMKPLNLIVFTDGVPSDDVESVLLSAAKKLDKLDAPPYQVGVQFFQVGNEEGAREALEELDDGLSALVEGGVRDIVDTVTWAGPNSASDGGVGLTGDGVLKCVLGAVVKRLDRRPAGGEGRRQRS